MKLTAQGKLITAEAAKAELVSPFRPQVRCIFEGYVQLRFTWAGYHPAAKTRLGELEFPSFGQVAYYG
jgi:hypothetical protein